MTISPLARRDAIRAGLLSLGLAGAAGTLTACSDDDTPARKGPATTNDGGIELVSSDVKRAAGDTTVLPDVVTGLQALAGDLYAQLAGEPGNLVLSPYSVLVALGMTLTGAGGATAEEMRAVLGAGTLGDRWHKGVNAMTSYVDGLAGEQERGDGSKAELALATANQVFGQTGVGWEEEFLDLLGKEYGAPLRSVDYQQAAEQARVLINGWVEDQTDDRIVDLVPEGGVDASTRLVLVNAIYLKAPWEDPFEKGLTAKAAFNRADGSTVDVDMMRKPDLSGALTTGSGWRAATLPYAGRRLAMTIVLPDAGLEAVEQVLTADGAGAFLAGGRPSALDLSLPKWTFRSAAPLKDPLIELGMPTAFGGAADFTPMTTEDLDLVISEVFHQGFIAVDEEGTEAAAATAVVVRETSAPVAEPFQVDRPYLFVIHDLEHATPLFVGRVVDPTA